MIYSFKQDMISMKKIALFLAAAAVFGGLSSCSRDESPVLQKPTEFKLNTPPFAAEYYQLTEGNSMIVTCSQPNYGIGVQTTYSMDISIDENFGNSLPIKVADPFSATMVMSDMDVNQAILDLLGISDADTWAPYENNHVHDIFFRATAQLAGIEGTSITSNIVKVSDVDFFFTIKEPGFIYLVGAPEGWVGPTENQAAHYADWRLFEADNNIGSEIYIGTFDVAAGSAMFRFYTALTGWDEDSYGSQAEDNPLEFQIADGVFDGTIVKGKGAYSFPDWQGGLMTIIVNLKNGTIHIEAGAVKPASYIYMVGNNAGWAEPNEANAATYDNWRLADKTGDGIYSGTFTMPDALGDDNALYCRFYKSLSGWGPAAFSSSTDGSVNLEVTSGQAADAVEGEGCFLLKDAAGKGVTVTVDANTSKVTFTIAN